MDEGVKESFFHALLTKLEKVQNLAPTSTYFATALQTEETLYSEAFRRGKNVNVSIDRLTPCFSDNSSKTAIESSIGKDTPNKLAKMPEKKIRFAPLPLPASTRAT
ncbi:hypothetical protein TNIN_118351 [Trichonephila inaurata madagascariensis]|uniref:Uncharacterized protein n=1 Tax=Trichonephila inaurata madagascariensis TaxID=2747483 RepID=A0A8X6WN33_9ARAC|nr:hypothetical protein TNIN_118351 [Trichonephila inaurata madagascariensis]